MSRRAALAGVAALVPAASAAAMPVATSVDPVFAIVEAHKAAYAAYDAIFKERHETEEAWEEWEERRSDLRHRAPRLSATL